MTWVAVRPRLRFVGAALAFACAGLTSIARGDEPTPIHVAYDVDEGCPPVAAFVAEVTARTSHARLAGAGETAREFRVSIHQGRKKSRMEGRVEVASGGVRDVDGASCADVVSALALITALTIDPAASTAPLPAAASPAPTTEPPPVAPPSVAVFPAAAPPATTRATSPAPRRDASPPPSPRPEPKRWTLGAHLTVATEAAPRPLVGGAAFVELRSRRTGGPAARVSAGYATTGPFGVGVGGAVFTAATARIEGCPLSWSLAEGVSLVPCAGLTGGALRGQGLQSGRIVQAKEAIIPWLGVDLATRFQLEFQRLVVFEVQAGSEFPFVRHTFVFEHPDQSVHSVPAVTFTGAAGVGVRFR